MSNISKAKMHYTVMENHLKKSHFQKHCERKFKYYNWCKHYANIFFKLDVFWWFSKTVWFDEFLMPKVCFCRKKICIKTFCHTVCYPSYQDIRQWHHRNRLNSQMQFGWSNSAAPVCVSRHDLRHATRYKLYDFLFPSSSVKQLDKRWNPWKSSFNYWCYWKNVHPL